MAPSALESFLKSNAVTTANTLPLTHVTQAYFLRNIIEKNEILCQPCDVFIGDNLSYFFMGRPSYKYLIEGSSEFWHLPLCFIIKYESLSDIKRIYPFDTGGFQNGLMKSVLDKMPMLEFEISSDRNSCGKLIGAFFGTPRNYFDFKGRSTTDFNRDFTLSPLDAEIHALHKLSLKAGSHNFDDRNFSIEVQTDKNVPLNNSNVLTVVLPIIYLDDEKVVDQIENKWNAQIITYDILPLNIEYYYSNIYEKVREFMKMNGHL